MAFISDQQWRRIEPFLARGKRVGRPRKSDRETLEAVLYVLTTGCRWCDLPRDMGSYVTAWRRFTTWKKDGTFDIIRSCLPASIQLSENASTPRKIKEGKCSLDAMCAIMSEEKKGELDRVTLKNDVLRKYFPKNYTPKQMEDTIIKLLEQWQKKRQRDMER